MSRTNAYYRAAARTHDVLFSRSGFTEDLSQAAASDSNIELLDPERLLK